MPNLRKIASHYLYTPRGFCQNGIVSIDNQGVIVAIEYAADRSQIDAMEGVEFYDGLLVPGFINAHCHLELSYLCGALAEGFGNAAFAAEIGTKRNLFTAEQQIEAANFYDAKMHSEGIVAVGDVCNSPLTFDLKTASQIVYLNFIELFGLAHKTVEPIEATIAAAQNSGLRHSVTPHSTYSLNDEAFRAAVKHNENPDVPLSIHFMESPAEAELFERRGAMWEWYERSGFKTDFLGYGSPAERIIKTIPAGQRMMLIHNTFVQKSEVGMLQDHFGDRLTWVLCPRSNHYINRAEPPVAMLSEMGGRIALGTDSLASNHSLSMLEEMKALPDAGLQRLLHWATLGGAEALGIEDQYGSLDIGKRPGILILSSLDWHKMQLTSQTTIKVIR